MDRPAHTNELPPNVNWQCRGDVEFHSLVLDVAEGDLVGDA